MLGYTWLGHTWLSLLHPPYLWLQAAGLAPAVLAEIASSVPIPLNIDIVVRLLLLLVTSKNEINRTNRASKTIK